MPASASAHRRSSAMQWLSRSEAIRRRSASSEPPTRSCSAISRRRTNRRQQPCHDDNRGARKDRRTYLLGVLCGLGGCFLSGRGELFLQQRVAGKLCGEGVFSNERVIGAALGGASLV